MMQMGVPDEFVNRRATPDELGERLLGTDISTLTERIESGRF
jgi:hypothetical protein